ncbi:peroxidase mlt-7-like [Haliotis rubra]|uniref:peroxidase mlt-7-like n=1 Tax=Haliotis rubra TaxID=36100 RepID=UPI001EE5D45B|nr:peroxidase mlt-7-like [Haliotis rubra]
MSRLTEAQRNNAIGKLQIYIGSYSCNDQVANDRAKKFSSITFTSLVSSRRGEDHRLNVIISRLILQHVQTLGTVPPSILEEGFGPQIHCDVEPGCNEKSHYREADGRCNNLVHSRWGSAFIPMRRWMPPVYDDAPAEQMNQITAFIDASQVYGSSYDEQIKVRTFHDGKLKTVNHDFLPPDLENKDACDHRVNENPGLQSMHTIFVREHNRLASRLKELNCNWGDDRVFQEARKIVGAFIQKITYGDWLPIIIGDQMDSYGLSLLPAGYSNDYDTTTDPSIRNAFAAAALRMGHSMVRVFFASFSPDYSDLGRTPLREVFENTHLIISEANRTVGGFIRGLVTESVQSVDRKISPEITDHLFPDGHRSMDLASLNIQRGRDHGIPPYTAYRKFCGKPSVTSFDSLINTTHSAATVNKFKIAYDDVNDIDLWSGGVSEEPVPGGILGPTLACLLGKQFQAFKTGDRFWFEGDDYFTKFSPAQLAQIRKASLSRIICDNTDTVTIQENAFSKGDKVDCSSLDTVDLTAWKQESGSWSGWNEWGPCNKHVQTRTRSCEPCKCGWEGPNVDSRSC